MDIRRHAVASRFHQKNLENVRSKWCCSKRTFITLISCLFSNRSRKRKRIAKAIERRAKKLRAKGISVDLEALKADYIAHHRGQFLNSSDSEDNDDPIDVVGGTEELSDCRTLSRLDCLNDNNKSDSGSLKSKNIFSIERILCRNSWERQILLGLKFEIN